MNTDSALAAEKKLAPQEIRTFFVSSSTAGGRKILQSDRMAELLVAVLRENRERQRLEIHEFVIMPDHVHLLLTPAEDISLEKCLQYIKGAFSYRAKKELGFNGEIWEPGYNEQRIKSRAEYENVARYIRMNPVKAHLANSESEYRFSSANGEWDPAPVQFRG